ncbi:MAG: preprotein translocase subunit SecY [Planctomycetes bacterium]|nr:preprotein translocase subunit SecY [Planctomycetota bacterium]
MERIKEVLSNIFKIPELRRRILMTFGLLAIFRFGCYVALPGVDVATIQKWMASREDEMGRMLGLLSIFSGGAFTNLSIFSLGIMPYISASIIFQLLVKIVPSLEALAKEGPSGYRKIAQYTRLATLPICVIQGLVMVRTLEGTSLAAGQPIVLSPGWGFRITSILAFTAGTMFVMWLGEQITEHGIGNGSSLIIMAGIIARMPQAALELWRQRETHGPDKPIILLLLYLGVIIAVVYTTQAQRRIQVQHARHTRGRRVYGGHRHYLPLRVNQAGVMPVIFASSLMVIPDMIAKIGKIQWLQDIFLRTGFWFSIIYMALVFFFSYFWTALFFQPVEMANQLKEYGSFVPGIRPGRRTAEYLEFIMNRVTLAGATFLCFIALMPDLVAEMLDVGRYITAFLGGTGILIVVGVGLDMMQKIESHLLMRQYEGFMKKGRVRGRR